tara:strand:- start:466 stop:690 length:225 start_codon:yes stop_codon:yes gene_type:complete
MEPTQLIATLLKLFNQIQEEMPPEDWAELVATLQKAASLLPPSLMTTLLTLQQQMLFPDNSEEDSVLSSYLRDL